MGISLRRLASIIFRKPSAILREIFTNSLMNEWIKNNPSPEKFSSRYEMYNYINSAYCSNGINYLEFGVAEGRSIKYF